MRKMQQTNRDGYQRPNYVRQTQQQFNNTDDSGLAIYSFSVDNTLILPKPFGMIGVFFQALDDLT